MLRGEHSRSPNPFQVAESSWRPKSDLAPPGWGHCHLFTHTLKYIFCLPEEALCLERRGPATPGNEDMWVGEREEVKRTPRFQSRSSKSEFRTFGIGPHALL